MNEKKIMATLEEIIKEADTNIPTLEQRNSDGLDFHEISVWALADLMRKAYLKGMEAGITHDQ